MKGGRKGSASIYKTMPNDSQPTGVVKCHLCLLRGRPDWRQKEFGTQRTLSARQRTQQLPDAAPDC